MDTRRTITITAKIVFSFLLVGLAVIGIIGWQVYSTTQTEFFKETSDLLVGMRENKKNEIENYFKNLHNECLSTSESTMTFDAMHAFDKAFQELKTTPEQFAQYKKDLAKFYEQKFLPKINETATTPLTLEDIFPLEEKTIILQALYIAQNPNPLEQKRDYNKAPDGSAYSQLHAKYHGIFKKMIERLGFIDIYLVNILTGEVVFNISKEIDFATNLLSGPLRKSNLAKIFKSIQQTSDENFVELIDHDFYVPSYGVPHAFIGTPIYQKGKKIGALMFEIPIDRINNIMTFNKRWQDVGLGVTGETFLIGQDKKMRTVSRSFIEDKTNYFKRLQELQTPQNVIDKMKVFNTTILLQNVDTQAARDIFNGITNIATVSNYLDHQSLAAFAPLDIHGVSWGIITQLRTDEAYEPIRQLYKTILLTALFLLLLIFCFGLFFARYITKPPKNLQQAIHEQNGKKIAIAKPIKTKKGCVTETVVEQYNLLMQRIFDLFTKCKGVYTTNDSLNKNLQQTIKQLVTKANQYEHKKQDVHDELKDNNTLFDELLLIQSTQEAEIEQLQNTTQHIVELVQTATTQLQTLKKDVEQAFTHYDNVQKKTLPLNTYIHNISQSITKLTQQVSRAISYTHEAKDTDVSGKHTLQTVHTAIENHATDITQTVDKLEKTSSELTQYVNHMKPHLKQANSTSQTTEQTNTNTKTTINKISSTVKTILKQEIHSKQFTKQLHDKIEKIIDQIETISTLKNELTTLNEIGKQYKTMQKELTNIINQIEW